MSQKKANVARNWGNVRVVCKITWAWSVAHNIGT